MCNALQFLLRRCFIQVTNRFIPIINCRNNTLSILWLINHTSLPPTPIYYKCLIVIPVKHAEHFPSLSMKTSLSLGISIMILLLLTAKLKLGIIYTFTVIGKYNNITRRQCYHRHHYALQIVHLTRSPVIQSISHARFLSILLNAANIIIEWSK